MKHLKIMLLIMIMNIPAASLKGADWVDPTSYDKKVQAEFSATGLLPIGDFSELYEMGFGGMLDFSYAAQKLQNHRLSFRTGYFHLLPKEETDDGYKTGISEGFIIPFLFNYEYRMSLFFYKRVKIAPSLAGGPSINRAVYDDRSGTIEDGVPTGRAAVKDRSVLSVEPMALAGINILYMLNWTDSIFIKSESGMIYESDTPMYFSLLNMGYEKRF
jgi:hypothetical protein